MGDVLLYYTFEDIMVDVQIDVDNFRREPRTVDWTYRVSVSLDDIFEYVCRADYEQLSKPEQDAYYDAIRHLYNLDLIVDLADDDDFIRFMTDKYRDDALEECEDFNS